MYGEGWTGCAVVGRLTACFKAIRGVPIWSPSKDKDLPDGPIDGIDLITATCKALGRESLDRKILLTYARAKADGHEISEVETSLGLSPSTFFERRKRAADQVAAWLNERAHENRIAHRIFGLENGRNGNGSPKEEASDREDGPAGSLRATEWAW